MGASRYIDPATRDYVVEGGSPREDDSEASTIVWLLGLERGTFAPDPDLGSRLHTLRKATRDAVRLGQSYALEALEPRIAAGAITKVSVSGKLVDLRPSGKALDLVVSYTDRRGQARAVPFRRVLGG